jgi:hypothetical protein
MVFADDCPPEEGSVVPRNTLIKTTAIVLGVALTTLGGAAGASADPTASAPSLRINEIETDGSPDWVELINFSADPLDASGYVLTGSLNGFSVTLPANTVLPAGGVYVASGTQFPALKLKKGDTLTVLAADGTTRIDAQTWGDTHLSTSGLNSAGEFVHLDAKTPGELNPGQGGDGTPVDDSYSAISINEVTSEADTYELFNSGDADLDVADWLQDDSSHTPSALDAPNGTVVPAHGFLTLNSNQGLSKDGDAVRLYLSDGTTLVDEIVWTGMDAQPGSLSRCGDGSENWLHTERDSFGESNATACSGRIIDLSGGAVPCQTEPASDLGAEQPGGLAWPGSQDWKVADNQCQFTSAVSGQDVSGLDIDPSDPDVMWAVKNKNHVYRLIKDGDRWVKDPADGWAEGKDLVFPGATDPTASQPDTEGITVGPDGFLYVTTERDNKNKSVALDSVLRFDPNEAGGILHPTAQWNVTADLAGVIDPAIKDDANLGFEGITWVPDAALTASGFVDESTGRAYDPSDYEGHGDGLFFLALEKNGNLYAYALSGDGASAHRIATVTTGMPRIAEVQWDADNDRLWAVADDSVGGSVTVLKADAGGFAVDRVYNRPTGLANLNLEGFALAPDSTCVDGVKQVVRSDDGNNGGHSLWAGTVSCDLGFVDHIDASVTLSSASVTAGGTIDVFASGLTPGAAYAVVLHSDPITLGTATADATGRLALTRVTVPASVPAGAHTVTVSAAVDPSTVIASAPLTVTAAATAPGTSGAGSRGSLAATGADAPVGLVTFALLLGAVGAGLTGISRRRSA